MLNLQSIYFGQKHKDFNYQDMAIIKTISRLAKKHLRQAVNSCNGVGYVKGQCYYNGSIDDYAKRTYGQNVKSAYLDKGFDNTIFDVEMLKIEEKINNIIIIANKKYTVKPGFDDRAWKVEFQGNPRGNTVKLYYESDFIEL
jgi:hypothetical protein